MTPEMSLESDEEYIPACKRKKPPKVQGDSRSPKVAEKKQLNKLVTQHLLQLIGIIKWSNAIVIDHEKQVIQREKSEREVPYILKTNNVGAYGLFIFQHRVYLTHLKVILSCSSKEQEQEPFQVITYRTAVRIWGQNETDTLGGKQYVSTKFTIMEKYLDIFEPAHLKALLIYLRIIIWGQSPFAKVQLKPKIQHKD
jgi:hypothetical protein